MATVHDRVTPAFAEWLVRQRMFFVATAPLNPAGHVNVSPKGLDTFRVFDEHTVGYLDLTGSGVETIAHLRENGRITLMFCAFEGPPRIVRVWGRGRVVPVDDPEWDRWSVHFNPTPGARAVIVVETDEVGDSCGFAVPLFDFVGQRQTLVEWAERRGDAGLDTYRAERNALSLDGLPGWR